MCCRNKEPAGLSSFGSNSRRCAQILVIGEISVGKTSLLKRFIGEPFVPETVATLGVDFIMMDIDIDDEEFKIQLWDTSGQEMFHALTKSFYRRAAGVILVYEERKQSTAYALQNYWIPQLKEHNCPATHLLIVGNKCDELRPDKQRVPDETLKAMATGFDTIVHHLSAKSDVQGRLDEIIDDFCKRVLIHKFKLTGPLESTSSSGGEDPMKTVSLKDGPPSLYFLLYSLFC